MCKSEWNRVTEPYSHIWKERAIDTKKKKKNCRRYLKVESTNWVEKSPWKYKWKKNFFKVEMRQFSRKLLNRRESSCRVQIECKEKKRSIESRMETTKNKSSTKAVLDRFGFDAGFPYVSMYHSFRYNFAPYLQLLVLCNQSIL